MLNAVTRVPKDRRDTRHRNCEHGPTLLLEHDRETMISMDEPMASILYVSDRRKKEGEGKFIPCQDFLVSRYAGLLLVGQSPTRFSGEGQGNYLRLLRAILACQRVQLFFTLLPSALFIRNSIALHI